MKGKVLSGSERKQIEPPDQHRSSYNCSGLTDSTLPDRKSLGSTEPMENSWMRIHQTGSMWTDDEDQMMVITTGNYQ